MNFKNKTLAIIGIFVMLSIIATPCISTVKAQSFTTIPTLLFMTADPNPIGVGQTITLSPWLNLEPLQYSATGYYYWNFTINVVSPSGANTTLGPFSSASTGGYYTTYVPETTGNYTFQAYFPQTTINIPTHNSFILLNPGTYTYPAAESSAITVNVQTTQLQAWPQTPLPTSYWQTPIFSENQNWYVLAGNWLRVGRTNPQTQSLSPTTSHILWTMPLTFGGISGGEYGQGNTAPGTSTPYTTSDWGINYYTGLLYQTKFQPIIISGYLYYNDLPSTEGLTGMTCVNLRTGQLVWTNETMPICTCGQVYTFQGGDQSGSLAYLWSSYGGQWQCYDAFTGRQLCAFTSPLGALPGVPGPDGELLVYVYQGHNGTAGFLTMWNSSLAILGGATEFAAMSYTPWTPAIRPWSEGIQWNVSVAATQGDIAPWVAFNDYYDGILVVEDETGLSTASPIFSLYGYSDTTGALTWAVNYTNVGWGEGGPGNNGGLWWYQSNTGMYGSGFFDFFQRETMVEHVCSIFTGQPVFVTQPLNTYTGTDLSYYDWTFQSAICNGIMYCSGYSGCITAFNLTSQQEIWCFKQINPGITQPSGTWPTCCSAGVVDTESNILYYSFTQHSPGTPLFRGYNLYAINYSTGQELWQLAGFANGAEIAIADGELISHFSYDNQIYAIGTGNSATTVSAPQDIQTLGNKVQIQGTVTDQSPGQTCLGVPAAGTPAIADAYMDQWMAYLYQQQPEPMNATGVPVTLTALDPNGNIVNIGSTTSDMTGNYVISWTPQVPGTYTITASFAGTNSYYPSSAETHITVGEAPAATVAPTASPTSVADTYFVPAIAGLFVLIIVGLVILALLMLRKRP